MPGASAAAVMPSEPTRPAMPDSTGGLAVQLLAWADAAPGRPLVHVAASERRADEIGRILAGLAPDLDVIVLPPWDCLPYDRASPSRAAMGCRAAALRRLSSRDGARILVTTPDALVQRVPPRETWGRAAVTLKVGDAVSPDELRARLSREGYLDDERVDEPGEMAFRGQVVDIYPAGAASPYRVEHDGGVVTAIRPYDPVTQLTVRETDSLFLDPASEVILAEAGSAEPEAANGGAAGEPERFPGIEHWLPGFYPKLETVFDLVPGGLIVLEPKAKRRHEAVMEQISDGYESRRLRRAKGALPRPLLPPDRLYLSAEDWAARLAEHEVIRLAPAHDEAPRASDAVPRFATQASPNRGFAAFLRDVMARDGRVVLAAATDKELAAMSRRAEKAAGKAVERIPGWAAALDAPPGALLGLPCDLEHGFVDPPSGIAVVSVTDLLGSRAATDAGPQAAAAAMALGEAEFQLGDAVIHMDHGMAVLSGLDTVQAGEAAEDAVRLTYKDDAKLLAPVDELGRVWRYGSEADAVPLDKLDGETWAKRRASVEAEIAAAAAGLVAAAKERDALAAAKLVPPRATYERFVARFPFAETPDQARAIADTLRDLASGRPMDRLVCGDVGFGKTEVALRAAAAAALAGRQVAVVAPTTVLVRQHLETFRRRFGGLGIEVAHLSRLAKPAEAKAVKQGLADGSVRVVIGTHALGADGVSFADLGLLIIDEEQRFGAAHKAKLRALGEGLHVLTLTATPIPRTLQAAMVGLQELSIIATPPAQRRPIRTFFMGFDPVTVREALIRERRRGGQSFFVCPRVEDIAPMAARLKELVPELEVLIAHGKMPAEDMDEAMVRFADGEGDVLLATNIIESGLDVPRANTMLVWRADRFGLAQLHQLRGRVGRGRVRGLAYLLTDPDNAVSEATAKRLSTLESLDRLGAGFAISARDLDLRGAGDLLGDEQAGHVKLIGVGLYQHLLARAIRVARGEAAGEDWSPDLNIGVSGRIPEGYVPEPEVRINLYARLARVEDEAALDRIQAEIEDRFGSMPEEVRDLLAAVRLKTLCCRLGVARLDAGPQAIALTFRPGMAGNPALRRAAEGSTDGLTWRGERLVWTRASDGALERQQLAGELLERIGASA